MLASKNAHAFFCRCKCVHICKMCVIPRYKSLVGIRELPPANGENCVLMLSKLCPLRPGAYHVGVTKVRFSSSLFKLTLFQMKGNQQYKL